MAASPIKLLIAGPLDNCQIVRFRIFHLREKMGMVFLMHKPKLLQLFFQYAMHQQPCQQPRVNSHLTVVAWSNCKENIAARGPLLIYLM